NQENQPKSRQDLCFERLHNSITAIRKGFEPEIKVTRQYSSNSIKNNSMRTPMLDVEGFILVGGASSRMGVNKANLLLNGKTTVSLISEALRSVTSRVSVVGTSVEATSTGLPGVPDLHESWGPLGGIQAALHACKSELCLVIACDLPFVTGELFAYLLQIEGGSNTTSAAVVPLQSDGRPQPLCAVYRKQSCLAAAEKSIALGEHSPRAML